MLGAHGEIYATIMISRLKEFRFIQLNMSFDLLF